MFVKKVRDLSRFIITETEYQPDQKLIKHNHSDARLVILIKGGFTENCEGKSRSFINTGLVFRPPNETHSNHFHRSGAYCLNILLKQNWLSYVSELGVKTTDSAKIKNSAATFLAFRLYDEFHHTDEISALAIEGLLLEIITEITRFQMSSKII